MKPHLLLVDCSAFAYRAYYSQPALRRMSDGEPTGALLGFASMIWRMLGAVQADPATHAAAVFDAPGGTFRHKLMPSYKGHRDPDRALNLEKQLPLMRPVAQVLGLTPVERKGFEADDVIATLAVWAMGLGIRTTIVSSDKDFAQLVVDGWIEIVDPMARGRNPDANPRKLVADVVKKFGVPPILVPDVQALAGDAADGIPGVKGIGLERAAALVRRFGSLDAVLKNTKLVPRARERQALERSVDKARLYLKLTTLRRNVPLKFEPKDLIRRDILKQDLIEVVKAINPAANVQALFGLDLQDARGTERVADPLEWWREELRRPAQRLPEEPQCGFYKRCLVAGGPWVPARIWREPYPDPVTGKDTGTDVMRCEVAGRPRDPMAEFVRLSMNPIKESDFKYLVAAMEHAKAHKPGSPLADPAKPIDLTKQPVSTNPRKRR